MGVYIRRFKVSCSVVCLGQAHSRPSGEGVFTRVHVVEEGSRKGLLEAGIELVAHALEPRRYLRDWVCDLGQVTSPSLTSCGGQALCYQDANPLTPELHSPVPQVGSRHVHRAVSRGLGPLESQVRCCQL